MKHWLYGSGIRVFHAEGGDGGGGGEGGEGGEAGWQADFPGLAGTDAAKALSKYDSAEKALLAAGDMQNVIRQPFRLPKDLSKLTEEQAADFQKGLNTLRGAPETVEGYKITVPEGLAIDQQAMTEYLEHCVKRGRTQEEAQTDINIHAAMVKRLNQVREEAIKEMTEKNYEQFVKEQGSAADADLRIGYIKEYLQTFCLGEDGNPNKDVWEAFAARILFNDRIIELPLLRALSEPARMARAGGAAPYGEGSGPDLAQGALSYPEMKKK